jgi:high-affinity nickel permease
MGIEPDHSRPSSVQVKKEWSYTSNYVLLERAHERHYFSLTNAFFIIIFFFFHGLGHLTCSDIDALSSFSGTSTISSSSGFVVEGMFRKSGVVHSSKMVNPILFVFGSHILHSRDFQVFSYDFTSYFV